MEVTVREMKKIEREADSRGLSYTSMMENAGQAATRLLYEKINRPIHTAAVFCGSGNNGGDGFVLARALCQTGVEVRLILVEGEPRTEDAILNRARAVNVGAQQWDGETLTDEQKEFIRTADVVVDAIYGTGFHGELRPAGRKAADQINAAQGFKLALDLPSGLYADNGKAAEGAVKADLTVTFHASKPCHRLAPEQCGEVVVASIGIEFVPLG